LTTAQRRTAAGDLRQGAYHSDSACLPPGCVGSRQNCRFV